MKYNYEFCSRCKRETWQRSFRRYGKAEKGRGRGKKGLRRSVVWCLQCQKRRIDKQSRQKRTKHISLRS